MEQIQNNMVRQLLPGSLTGPCAFPKHNSCCSKQLKNDAKKTEPCTSNFHGLSMQNLETKKPISMAASGCKPANRLQVLGDEL
jgi:hypothetical protein